MPYPTANIIQITSSTACTAEWANMFNDNLKLMIQDVYRANGSVTNFKSMTRAILASTGQAKSGVIQHNQLGDITPDQHHQKYHAKTHTDGSDDIPLASTTRKGLVTATTAQNINGIVSGATRNWFILTSFTGDAAASRMISLGFRPAYAQIFHKHAASTANPNRRWLIELIDGANYAFRHTDINAGGSLYHTCDVKTNTINIVTNGVKVYASCNVATDFMLMAYKADPYPVTNYST